MIREPLERFIPWAAQFIVNVIYIVVDDRNYYEEIEKHSSNNEYFFQDKIHIFVPVVFY